MFFFNPDLAANDLMDDGDEAFDSYAREEEEDDGEVQVSFLFYKLFQSSFEVCLCKINVGDTIINSSNAKHFAMDLIISRLGKRPVLLVWETQQLSRYIQRML